MSSKFTTTADESTYSTSTTAFIDDESFDMISRIIIVAVVSVSPLLLWCSCTICTGYRLYTPPKGDETKISKTVKNVSTSYLINYLTALFACIILTVFVFIFKFENFYNIPEDQTIGWTAMMSIVVVTGAFGYLSFYSFIIFRLYFIFQESALRLSKWKISVYIVLTFIVAILLCVYALSYFIYRPLLEKYSHFVMGIAVAGVSINLFLATSLTYLLIIRLIKLTKMIYEVDLATDDMHELEEQTTELNESQMNLLYVVTKQSVLSSIAILMWNIMIPIDVAIYVWVLEHNILTFLGSVYVALLLHCIEMICVVLSFPFNKKIYHCACKLCDVLCIHFWEKYTRNLNHKVKTRRMTELSAKMTELATPNGVDSPGHRGHHLVVATPISMESTEYNNEPYKGLTLQPSAMSNSSNGRIQNPQFQNLKSCTHTSNSYEFHFKHESNDSLDKETEKELNVLVDEIE